MVADHRELAVWQKAHRLTLEIYAATKQFPKEERYGLTAQLRRAAVGVAAIARGSASEEGYLLLVSKDLGYLSQDEFAKLSDGYDHVSRMLTKMLRSLAQS